MLCLWGIHILLRIRDLRRELVAGSGFGREQTIYRTTRLL